jgi:Na+-driven multidrug efflux pump
MIGINVLGQIFLSQFFGSKKRNKFKETLKIIALINFKISIIMFLIIFFLNEKIVRIFNNKDKEIIDLAIKYLNIMCFTIIASSISLSFLDALISIGRTKPFVIVSIISLILNVIFNFIFIYEFNLGIEGAAFSSLLSKIFELIVVCILVYKFKE